MNEGQTGAPTDAAAAQDLALFRGRWMRLLWFRYGLFYGSIWVVAFGVVVLAARTWQGAAPFHFFGLHPSLWWAVLGLGVLPVVWLAHHKSLSQMPDASDMMVWLDQRRRQGGLYMAQQEVPLEGWSHYLGASSREPVLQLRAQRGMAFLSVAMLFLFLVFLLPQKLFSSLASTMTQDTLEVGEQVTRLSKQIKTLKQEKILTPKQADQMLNQLDKLAKEARGSDPAKTLQALDHLSRRNQDMAMKALEKALAQAQRWSDIKRLSRTLEKHASKMQSHNRKNAIKRMAKMLSQAMKHSQMMSKSQKQQLRKMMQQALKSGSMKGMKQLTAAQQKMLSQAMKKMGQQSTKMQAAMAKFFKKLKQSGALKMRMLPPSVMKKLLAQMGKGKGKGIVGLGKAKGKGKCPGGPSAPMCMLGSNQPGKGWSVSRGRGDAPMTWKQASAAKGTKFKLLKLPDAQRKALQSYRIGMQELPPGSQQKIQKLSRVGSGALYGAKTGQSGAHRRSASPRHWGTIKRYFGRDKATGTQDKR